MWIEYFHSGNRFSARLTLDGILSDLPGGVWRANIRTYENSDARSAWEGAGRVRAEYVAPKKGRVCAIDALEDFELTDARRVVKDLNEKI
jgi:hypothetical protein